MEQGSKSKEVDDRSGSASVSESGVSVSGADVAAAMGRMGMAHYNLGAANTAVVLGHKPPFGKTREECQAEADAALRELGALFLAYVERLTAK